MKNKVHPSFHSGFHILRGNKALKNPSFFLFADTETKARHFKWGERQTFKLACSIFWDRKKDFIEKRTWKSPKDFWNYLEHLEAFTAEKRRVHRKKQKPYSNKRRSRTKALTLFFHNADFDFKILDGFRQLEKRKWKLKSFCVKQNVFMLEWRKENKKLLVWDSCNYTNPRASVYQLGKSIGLPKLKIDFKNCSMKELERYCVRDTEICYFFIRKLVEFLEKNDLSKLKPTAASLAFNTLRHRFYDLKKNPIVIHNWKNCIKLERASYRGGMTEIFELGNIKDGIIYRLDVNSMYPSIMASEKISTNLRAWLHDGKHSNGDLMKLYSEKKGKFLTIARALISLPEKYAFAYRKEKDKTVRRCGKFEGVWTTPELEFIERHGKILKIREIAFYEGSKTLFKKYVDFFFKKKSDFKRDGNRLNAQFCKYMMNSLYGKFGQSKPSRRKLTSREIEGFKKVFPARVQGARVIEILDGTDDTKKTIVHLGNNYFLEQKDQKINSKDSFVAVCSFITAYARMKLTNYILKAKQRNCYYCDTDSLFVNEKGLYNLRKFIEDNKLGCLKVEDKSSNVKIYGLKDYEFGKRKTRKGVKRNAELVRQTDREIVYRQPKWERFNSSIRNNHLNAQYITPVEKHFKRGVYDKGLLQKDGRIRPLGVRT